MMTGFSDVCLVSSFQKSRLSNLSSMDFLQANNVVLVEQGVNLSRSLWALDIIFREQGGGVPCHSRDLLNRLQGNRGRPLTVRVTQKTPGTTS